MTRILIAMLLVVFCLIQVPESFAETRRHQLLRHAYRYVSGHAYELSDTYKLGKFYCPRNGSKWDAYVRTVLLDAEKAQVMVPTDSDEETSSKIEDLLENRFGIAPIQTNNVNDVKIGDIVLNPKVYVGICVGRKDGRMQLRISDETGTVKNIDELTKQPDEKEVSLFKIPKSERNPR